MASQATSSSGAPSSSTTNVNTTTVNTTTSQIDIDELAREKVDEVEKSLDSLGYNNVNDINCWLSILKQIITAADLHRTNDKNDNSPQNNKNKQSQSQQQQQVEVDESIYADYADDNEQFNAVDLTEQFASNSVKWTIRVRAFKLVHRIVNLALSTNTKLCNKSSLLPHLSDLIRLSFVAATSPYDDLKIQGFEMFKVLIDKFASFEEKEFPGHSILEQYKTQVLSAIKPAFDLDAPPYITAIASQVCCLWLCNGLEKTESDLKRTYQLMLTTIDKLENQNINQNSKLYTESELEQERIDILGSWAQLYIIGKNINDNYYLHDKANLLPNVYLPNSLDQLVKTQINSLIDKWWEALKDYALLIMPSSRIIDVSHDNNHVYTRDVALRLFSSVWPKLILASTIWLCFDFPISRDNSINNNNDSKGENEKSNQLNTETDIDFCDKERFKTSKIKYFKFICGIVMKELCNFVNEYHSRCDNIELQKDFLPDTTIISIRSLYLLVNNDDFLSYLSGEVAIAQELYTILHQILIINSKRKGQRNQMFKILLDNIFKLTVETVSTNPINIKYGVAQLIVLIHDDVIAIKNEALEEPKNKDIEEQKLRMYLRCSNLVNIIKLKPNLLAEDDNLIEALLDVFKSILFQDKDLSLTTSYLNLIKDLHKHMPKDYSSSTLITLFDSKSIVTSKLLKLIKENKQKDKNIIYLEAFMKFMILDIKSAGNDDRSKLIKTYQRLFIQELPNYQELISNGDISHQKIQELFDMIMKSLEDIKLEYPTEFKGSITQNLEEIYQAAIKFQQDMKTDMEVKQRNIKEAIKKPNNSNKLNTTKTTKIVLKADFSNFYGKK